MNFRLILILVLGLLIFTAQILFGLIFYNTYNSDEKGKDIYKEHKLFYFVNIGVLISMAIVNGLLFLKA